MSTQSSLSSIPVASSASDGASELSSSAADGKYDDGRHSPEGDNSQFGNDSVSDLSESGTQTQPSEEEVFRDRLIALDNKRKSAKTLNVKYNALLEFLNMLRGSEGLKRFKELPGA